MTIKYDIPRIRKQIHTTNELLSTHKREIRKSQHEITWKDVSKLDKLKGEATTLYQIRAHMRGRTHITKRREYVFEEGKNQERLVEKTFDDQEEAVGLLVRKYIVPECP